MQAYRQMLENRSPDVENLQAALHYSPDCEWSCLLQSCSLMKATGSPAGFQRLKKKIVFAKQEKNRLTLVEFNMG